MFPTDELTLRTAIKVNATDATAIAALRVCVAISLSTSKILEEFLVPLVPCHGYRTFNGGLMVWPSGYFPG